MEDKKCSGKYEIGNEMQGPTGMDRAESGLDPPQKSLSFLGSWERPFLVSNQVIPWISRVNVVQPILVLYDEFHIYL